MMLLISPARGLLFIMPILLLGVSGLIQRAKDRPWKKEWIAIVVILVGELVINASFVTWHAGWTFGPRYLTSTLVFFFIPMAFALDRAWYIPLFLLSFAQVGFAEMSMPHTPEYMRNPIVECMLPMYRYGYRAENLGTMLGLSGAASLGPWLLLTLILVAWGWPESGNFWKKQKPNRIKAAPWLYGTACAIILIGIYYVRSLEEAVVHGHNGKILRDYYDQCHRQAIRAAAIKEDLLYLNQRK
jgi:hypothetical protein